MSKGRRIQILDTTLRDGDQAPGFAFSRREKIRIALQLEMLGVDIVEGGFPCSSQAQFDDMRELAKVLSTVRLCAMTRAVPAEIERSGRAIEKAALAMLHTSIATSPIHREKKLRKSCSEVLCMAVEAVRCAKDYAPLVEIGAEDATRTELSFLIEFCAAVIEAGADIINIADTVGIVQPAEYALMIRSLIKSHSDLKSGKVKLSVHSHNDLGLALANTLAGIEAGASQAEVTLLGIGERAGNAALEELVTALHSREAYYQAMHTGVRSELLSQSTSLVSDIAAFPVSAIKPVVGFNIFAHGSGIHQHGILADEKSYSIVSPQRVGQISHSLILTRHSGSNGIGAMVHELSGTVLAVDRLAELTDFIKQDASEKKTVTTTEFLLILHRQNIITSQVYRLVNIPPSSIVDGQVKVTLEVQNQGGEFFTYSACGRNELQAIAAAIGAITCVELTQVQFTFSLCADMDEQNGRLELHAQCEGRSYRELCFGSDRNVVFAEALLCAANRVLALRQISKI